jgi:hypothetical protein
MSYRNYSNTFPVKLFDLVSGEDAEVVGWQGQGSAFQVRDMDKFVDVVLPRHFKHNNFTSFQRQLNLYGKSSLTCITIIDTIILHIHTNDAYIFDTYDTYRLQTLCLLRQGSLLPSPIPAGPERGR